MNIKNAKVERLADELAHMTGESKTAAILHALEERRERLGRAPSGKRRLARTALARQPLLCRGEDFRKTDLELV